MNPNLCPKCGAFDPHGVVYRGCCKNCIATGPAPKEEEMTIHTGGVRTDAELPPHIIGPSPILDGQPRVDGKLFAARTAERRALAREAYMAALGGLGAAVDVKDPVGEAIVLAIETVRRWDAFMAAVDAEGGE